MERNPLAMNVCLIFFVKTKIPKGYPKVVLKETVEKIRNKFIARGFLSKLCSKLSFDPPCKI